VTLVGLTLAPEARFLDLLEAVILEEPDYYEVAPETLWTVDQDGRLTTNDYHGLFAQLRQRTGRPFVAHGVGLSVGSVSPGDEAHHEQWLERIAETHRVFDFQWYTDHLGASLLDGRALTLPLPIPMTDEMACRVHGRLRALQQVVPDVGVENSVFYYMLGDPMDEPAFLSKIVSGPGMHLLLDLHNVFTMSQNFGFDVHEYVNRLPMDRVIELHLSGGSMSDPGWLPDGDVMRLDSHDGPVPEEVWELFEQVVPRCPTLRGVTLERLEGTVAPQDVAPLREELRRARSVVR
jgi:uncharacterized protein (UPF0276 family)